MHRMIPIAAEASPRLILESSSFDRHLNGARSSVVGHGTPTSPHHRLLSRVLDRLEEIAADPVRQSAAIDLASKEESIGGNIPRLLDELTSASNPKALPGSPSDEPPPVITAYIDLTWSVSVVAIGINDSSANGCDLISYSRLQTLARDAAARAAA